MQHLENDQKQNGASGWSFGKPEEMSENRWQSSKDTELQVDEEQEVESQDNTEVIEEDSNPNIDLLPTGVKVPFKKLLQGDSEKRSKQYKNVLNAVISWANFKASTSENVFEDTREARKVESAPVDVVIKACEDYLKKRKQNKLFNFVKSKIFKKKKGIERVELVERIIETATCYSSSEVDVSQKDKKTDKLLSKKIKNQSGLMSAEECAYFLEMKGTKKELASQIKKHPEIFETIASWGKAGSKALMSTILKIGDDYSVGSSPVGSNDRQHLWNREELIAVFEKVDKGFKNFFASVIYGKNMEEIEKCDNMKELLKKYNTSRYRDDPFFRWALTLQGNAKQVTGVDNNKFDVLNDALACEKFKDTIRPIDVSQKQAGEDYYKKNEKGISKNDEQLKKRAVAWYATSEYSAKDFKTATENVRKSSSILFQTLFLSQLAGVKIKDKKKGKQHYLDSSISISRLLVAGSRLLIQTPAQVEKKYDELYAGLLRTDGNRQNSHLEDRVATHRANRASVDGAKKVKNAEEKKTYGIVDGIKNLFAFKNSKHHDQTKFGGSFKHLGSRLAAGGFMHKQANGDLTANDGTNGELYIGVSGGDKEHKGAMLVGIETDSTGMLNSNGHFHSMRAKTEAISTFGMAKDRVLGYKYGGREVDASSFKHETLDKALGEIRATFDDCWENNQGLLNELIDAFAGVPMTQGELRVAMGKLKINDDIINELMETAVSSRKGDSHFLDIQNNNSKFARGENIPSRAKGFMN